MQDIQKLMPDEFNRKLKEWEMMKEVSSPNQRRAATAQQSASSSSTAVAAQLAAGAAAANGKKKKPREHKSRRSADGKYGDKWLYDNPNPGHHVERDSVWLEKELRKIQREKQRLDRERAKYAEREQK